MQQINVSGLLVFCQFAIKLESMNNTFHLETRVKLRPSAMFTCLSYTQIAEVYIKYNERLCCEVAEFAINGTRKSASRKHGIPLAIKYL